MSELGRETKHDFDEKVLKVTGRIVGLAKLGIETSAVVEVGGVPMRFAGKRDGAVERTTHLKDGVIRIDRDSTKPELLDKLG